MQIPLSKVNVSELSKSLLQHPEDLPKVLKTKKYILARLEGKNVKDANIEAGFRFNTTQERALSTPVAQILLDELVIQKIPNVEVSERLREMWDARKKTYTQHPKTKKHEEVDLGPDFEQQKYAMDKRLALGGYHNGELPENRQAQVVTNIQFITIDKKEVIEAKAA